MRIARFLAALVLLAWNCSGANLIQNSSFELNTHYWGLSEGNNMDGPLNSAFVSASGATGGPLGASTAPTARSGNYSMNIKMFTTNGGYRASIPYVLKPSTTYCLSFYGQQNLAGPTTVLNVNNCRGSSNPNFGGVEGPQVNYTFTQGSWTRYWTNWTTAGTSNTAFQIHFHNANFGSPTNFAWIDDIMLEEVDTLFTPPSTYAPCTEVETAIVFPDNRGANFFWTNETVNVPIITYNHSGSTVDVTNYWQVTNYRFDVIASNEVASSIAAGAKITNTVDMTPTTNVLGHYRVVTWVKDYDNAIAENTFAVIKRPVVMSYPPTNSTLGSMIPAERYFATNSWNIGFKWARTLSVGRTNSGTAGQWLRFSIVSGSTNQFATWLTNAGNQAGMSMMTNIGFNILGVFEWLRSAKNSASGDVWTNNWGVDHSKWTNSLLSNFVQVMYAQRMARAYSPWIKYWELGNEWDTEGAMIFPGGALETASALEAANYISNSWTIMKTEFPELVLIPINAFTPGSFHAVSNVLGSAFFADKILSSHVYPNGEHGAERLYTNVGAIFGVNEHWQTEAGVTSKSERQNWMWEYITFGQDAAGTKANEGCDPVSRSGQLLRNYVVWRKWPLNTKWMWHLVDEKPSIEDPQTHSMFDWDGSMRMRACVVSAIGQLFEGSIGRSNLLNNSFPGQVNGGKFARGTTNCPLVVVWATNDLQMYRIHVNLDTNKFNVYDMFGNKQEHLTNWNVGIQPWIFEGQAGTLSNELWEAVLISATYTDVVPPKVVFTHFPTSTNGVGITMFRWAARDNHTAQFPQGAGSGVTNLIQYRYKLIGYDSAFSAYRSDPTNKYLPDAFRAYYTNVPQGAYTFTVEAKDQTGNVGSNQWNWFVGSGVDEPELPPQSTTGKSRTRYGRYSISPAQ